MQTHVHSVTPALSTPYTRVRRHTYVDPDYTYSEEERARVREHRDSYAAFIRTRHSERMWRERERYIIPVDH